MKNLFRKNLENEQIKIQKKFHLNNIHSSLSYRLNILNPINQIIKIFAKRKNSSQETSMTKINISIDNHEPTININQKDQMIKNKFINHKKIIIFLFLGLIFLLIFFSFLLFQFFISSQIELPIINKIHRLLDFSNDYNSFSYKKTDNYCHYFIDGKDYFEDLFKNLMKAKESIYITDLWMSPELFLRRPVDERIYKEMAQKNLLTKDFGQNITRLMDILDYKAKQNVKIYLLIFCEWAVSLPTNSKHVEDTFNKLNKNINIIRFPKRQKIILWANHEKVVIIDKIIAYIGGFDLCWGRYDTSNHIISEKSNKENIYEYPFLDYANTRIEDFYKVKNYTRQIISREESPRLPWHDVQSRIIGPTVNDIFKHFVERWNFALKKDYISNKKTDNNQKKGFWNSIINFLSVEENKNETEFENYLLDINQEVNKELEKEIYKKYKGNSISDVQVLRSVSNWNIDLKDTESSILKAYYELIKNAKHYIFIENQYFISKSWTNEEKSNNKDIKKDIVKNEIAYYIRKRIEKAYENNENFKVYIFISLLPDFPGEIDESITVQTILKHTYRTICRNNGLSLIEQLEKKMGDKWKNYISFYSLRNHGLVNGKPKTEIIYIHSKLLIIDDTKVIIGSSNINDRSMLGNRDSEIAALIEEQKEDYYLMDGNNKYQASKFAVGLRRKIMAEHLGIDIYDSILDDPVSNELYNFMNSRARNNTKIYHDIFGCYPDDFYTNYQILKDAQKIKKEENLDIVLNNYMKSKNNIKGHIVEYPLLFLKDEKIGAVSQFFSFENFLPENIYT